LCSFCKPFLFLNHHHHHLYHSILSFILFGVSFIFFFFFMSRILSDSTNASPAPKSSALSTVLSLTHALSNSSPTKSFSPTFPVEDMADSAVDSVQKPNAQPGKRHFTCLALLKPSIKQSESASSLGASAATQSAFAQENTLGSKKRQKISSVPVNPLLDITGTQRLRHAGLPFPTRKRATSGLVPSKPAHATKPKSRTLSSATRPKIAYSNANKPLPSPSKRVARPPSHSDLAFMEVACKSVIHHWSHVIDLDSSKSAVYDLAAMDRELIKRMNDSLLKNGRRGALLAIARETMEKTADHKWRQNADVEMQDGDASMDVDENVFFDDADDEEEEVVTSVSHGSSRQLPPLSGLRALPVAFPTLSNSDQDIDFPVSCSEPSPSSNMRQIPLRTRNDSILSLPSRRRSSLTHSKSASTPSKTSTSRLGDPKPISHIVAIGILRKRNHMRPRKTRSTSTAVSVPSSSGSGPDVNTGLKGSSLGTSSPPVRPSPLSSSTTAEAVDFGFGYPVTIYSYHNHPSRRPCSRRTCSV
jgi:hypothetical protein